MTKLNALLGAAAVVFGSGCLVLFHDLSIERSRVQTLEAQLDQSQRKMQTQEPTPEEETAPTGELPQAAAATDSSSTSAATTLDARKPSQVKLRTDVDEWRQVRADPAYREAMLAQHRLQLEPQYADLKAELGLSPDETNRLLDLLAEQNLRENEYRTKDNLAENSESWEERNHRYRERYDQFESERRALLGEERFRTWTEYVNASGARAQVQDLRTQLATSSSPLRDDQARPLIKALAAEQQRHATERQEHHAGAAWTDETPAAERIAYMERRDALIEESLARTRDVGMMYLDSEQQQRFDEMLDRQRQAARAELEVWRTSLAAEKRARAAAGSR